MSELTKGPWKAKRLATYREPGWIVLWPDKGGTHMRRLDSNGNFTAPDAALIAAAPAMYAALVRIAAMPQIPATDRRDECMERILIAREALRSIEGSQ